MKRLLAATALALVASVTSGCGFHGVYSLPLPGAAGTGADTYTVKVQLADVLDLVPYSAVKVNGATVGHVRNIDVEGSHALVSCQIENKVRLPANSIARVEQTSVLGEKFVELEPPPDGGIGRLADGDVISLSRTDTDASVEEVLGALSLLINGGAVGQLHTITHEVGVALHGRTASAHALLDHLNVFVAGLDEQKGAIIHAMQGIDRLTRTVRQQEGTLVRAIDRIPPALRVLNGDRQQLVHMLTALDHFGSVATHVVRASHDDFVANLRNLQPTLSQLAKVGAVIPKTLGVIITYPTADTVEQEYFGDYGNLALTLDMSVKSLAQTFGPRVGHAIAKLKQKHKAVSGKVPSLNDLLTGALP